MIIEHPKILTMKPVWAKFNGYSLIFDGVDASVGAGDYAFSNNPKTVAAFDGIAKALRKVGRRNLVRNTLVCLLPKASYHVTAVDLINQGNAHRVADPFKERVRNAIERVDPRDSSVDPVFLEFGMSGGSNASFKLNFAFDCITTMGGRALGLKLRPATPKDDETLAELKAWRTKLQERVLGGLALPIRDFEPHLTLGYFPNERVFEGQENLLDDLNSHMAGRLKNKVFCFEDVSLYGFTGMHAFYRVTS